MPAECPLCAPACTGKFHPRTSGCHACACEGYCPNCEKSPPMRQDPPHACPNCGYIRTAKKDAP
jgi:hypothetical protein